MSFYKNPIFWIVLLFIVYLLLPSNTSTSYVSSSSSIDELTKIQNTIDNFNAVFNDVTYESTGGTIKFNGNSSTVTVTKKTALTDDTNFEFYVEVPLSHSKYTSSNTYTKFNVISDLGDIFILKSTLKNPDNYSGRSGTSSFSNGGSDSIKQNIARAFRYIFSTTSSGVFASNTYGTNSAATDVAGTRGAGVNTVSTSDSNKKPISVRF